MTELQMTVPLTVVFAKKLPFDDAWRLCDAFGSEIFYPESESSLEENLFVNRTLKAPKVCGDKVWIPIRR